MHLPARPWTTLLLSLLAFAGACKDQGKLSAQKASQHVAALSALADKDVSEVERGLPQGATELVSLLYAKGADPRQDVAGVRRALRRIRADVADLTIAKSTFFALADEKGIAIRNDLEEDAMAGQDVLKLFPDLRKVLEGSFATAQGKFVGPTSPQAPDRDWVAATPIQNEGHVAGLLLTGWTYRRFANHLQETLRHDLTEEALKSGGGAKLPILYVAMFDRTGVYGAPFTPEVNEKALADADLVGKTASGPCEGTVSITDRDFGYAAVRVPKLGPELGIAVLRSEI